MKKANYNYGEYTEVIKHLKKFINIKFARKVKGGTHLFDYNNQTYLLGDNGGETNVILINKNSRSIPHTSTKIDVLPKVLAYRIAVYLEHGYKDINWAVSENLINEIYKKYNTYDIYNTEIINYYATGGEL